MFTGLVSGRGRLSARQEHGPDARLLIGEVTFDPGSDEPFVLGESIAVDGTCLSVVEIVPGGFTMHATAETLARTTLGALAAGSAPVNLERSLRLSDRLGGHFMTGHVDAVGTLALRAEVGAALALTFRMPPAIAGFVAEKGSVAVNGVSMTVNAAGPDTFEVMVIPITQEKTNLGALRVGGWVNLEVDLVARYVARLVAVERA